MTPTPMNSSAIGTRRDYVFGFFAGLAIGVLALQILQILKPSLYLSLRFVLIPLLLTLTLLGLVIASWIAHKFSFVWQLAKFIVIGGLNTLVDLGILSFLSRTMLPPETPWFNTFGITVALYSLYKGLSFILANINSYFWNKYWTFNVNASAKTGVEFASFFVVSIIGFIINLVVSSGIFNLLHLPITPNQLGLLAAAVGSIAGLAWNFLGYKFVVFKK